MKRVTRLILPGFYFIQNFPNYDKGHVPSEGYITFLQAIKGRQCLKMKTDTTNVYCIQKNSLHKDMKDTLSMSINHLYILTQYT